MKSHLRTLSAWLGLAALFPATLAFAVPANDDFDSPMAISGFPLVATGSNVEATVESGEALPAGYENQAVKSVWFSWTAPTSGLVQIDTFGSHQDSEYWDPEYPWFNPTPSVWLGDTLETLVEVPCGGTQQSRYLNAVSGTTYRIAVFGLQNDYLDEGQIVLNVTNDATAGISGTVTDTNGVPLSGIAARAQHLDDHSWEDGAAWAFTDAAGNYAIRGLSNDSYRIRFGGPGFATEFYDDVLDRYDPYATDLDATTVLTITNGETIGNVDAALNGSASVSGTVTGPGGLPLAGIEVWIYYSEDWYNQETTTDENGEYLVENILPDAYVVRFSDPNGDYLDAGTNVVLGAGAHLADVDATLGVASKISGTVVADADAAPLEGIVVGANQWTGSEWQYMQDAWSDADGNFLIGGLAAGTYRIEFMDLNGDYLYEVYDDAASLDAGADVVVGAETVVSNVNAALAVASRIAGTVTGPDGTAPIAARVLLHRWNGAEWEQMFYECWTGGGGEYLFAGLAPGTYRVEFADDPYDDDDYRGAFFAEDVVLDAATARTGVNGSLAVARPEILEVRAGPAGVDVVFSGVPTRDYVLQRGILESNTWTDVGSPVYCETGTNLFSMPAPIDRIVDDFNDDVRDEAKWPYNLHWNGGAFAETNGRLEFTTTSAPPPNYVCAADLESAAVGQASRDFSAIVDLANVSSIVATRGSYFLVEIAAANNQGNRISVQFADWSADETYLGTYLRKDWSNVAGSGIIVAPMDAIRLRIDYAAQTQVMSTFYDVNPADADEWIPIDSFGVAGAGGADGNTDWALGETDPFVIGLRAICSFAEGADYVGIESGQMFIDNVRFVPVGVAGADHGAWRVRRY